MDTIEALARRAAAAALAEAAEVADADDGLRRIREDTTSVAARPSRPARRVPARRWVVLGTAAAVAAVTVAVGVVVAGRGDTQQLGPDPTRVPVSTAPASASTAPAAPSTSTAPTSTALGTLPPTVPPGGDPCATDVAAVVDTLVQAVLSGATPGCVGPGVAAATALRCGAACPDGAPTSISLGEVAPVATSPGATPAAWNVRVVVTYANQWGFNTQRLESWTVELDETGRAIVVAAEIATDDGAATASATVNDYLGAIAAGDYVAAASFLVDPGVPFAARDDLQPLGPEAESDLAGALRSWCEEPRPAGDAAICAMPDQLSTELTPTGPLVVAWYATGGRVVSAPFWTSPAGARTVVRGLPPLAAPLAAAHVVDAVTEVGATRAVVSTPTGFWVVADGAAVLVETGAPGSVWLDGSYAYWSQWGDGSDGSRSKAFLVDGTEVCAVQGAIHHVRWRADGGYVATVQRPATDQYAVLSETPVPAYAVDCATGSEQPIAPISWTAEASSRSTVDVGDRRFTAVGDVEGSVVVTNEAGVPITGAEWAITTDFTDDGSTIVYGAGGGGDPGVHDTNRLVAADASTGELLWAQPMPGRFTTFWIVGDRVVVAHDPPGSTSFGALPVEYTIVSLATGEVVASGVPATARIEDMS